MDDIVLVEEGDALDDGSECSDDFFFIEMDDVVASLPVLEFDLESRLLFGVEQSIIVLYGSQQSLVHNIGLMLGIGIGLKILIGLFGRLMK